MRKLTGLFHSIVPLWISKMVISLKHIKQNNIHKKKVSQKTGKYIIYRPSDHGYYYEYSKDNLANYTLRKLCHISTTIYIISYWLPRFKEMKIKHAWSPTDKGSYKHTTWGPLIQVVFVFIKSANIECLFQITCV